MTGFPEAKDNRGPRRTRAAAEFRSLRSRAFGIVPDRPVGFGDQSELQGDSIMVELTKEIVPEPFTPRPIWGALPRAGAGHA